ncbi:hypothetical protein B0J15DRAFT_545939 [Fusarium solani]|uniref:Uncharacterized protein n=1 Tax=Fusarium solani TaxID=169388 RepID=A0A9P9HZU2_FUSSL|nr:uncharacterized protein B0J15DRAFT_545939 [Fusarium solani]KAH7265912.1 hypothetical protein B0J15DRAFT_545939 [Fusarium solani]
MERDTPLLPECQGDDAGARAQRDRDSNTEPSTTKEPFFWWNPPEGPDGFIVVTGSGLWMEFHVNLTGAKRWLKKYLEHMNNIRTATSCASAPLDELQVTNAVRLFPRRQEPVSSVPSSTPTQGVDIDRERNMMKNYADLALLELHQMGEILDVIEMLPKRSEPMVSTATVLWTVACFISAATIPFQPVAQHAVAGVGIGAIELLKRPLSLEDKRISEKNKKDLDSWHLWARWWIFVKSDV